MSQFAKFQYLWWTDVLACWWLWSHGSTATLLPAQTRGPFNFVHSLLFPLPPGFFFFFLLFKIPKTRSLSQKAQRESSTAAQIILYSIRLLPLRSEARGRSISGNSPLKSIAWEPNQPSSCPDAPGGHRRTGGGGENMDVNSFLFQISIYLLQLKIRTFKRNNRVCISMKVSEKDKQATFVSCDCSVLQSPLTALTPHTTIKHNSISKRLSVELLSRLNGSCDRSLFTQTRTTSIIHIHWHIKYCLSPLSIYCLGPWGVLMIATRLQAATVCRRAAEDQRGGNNRRNYCIIIGLL